MSYLYPPDSSLDHPIEGPGPSMLGQGKAPIVYDTTDALYLPDSALDHPIFVDRSGILPRPVPPKGPVVFNGWKKTWPFR